MTSSSDVSEPTAEELEARAKELYERCGEGAWVHPEPADQEIMLAAAERDLEEEREFELDRARSVKLSMKDQRDGGYSGGGSPTTYRGPPEGTHHLTGPR
jgi:hypothetical protein